MLVDLLNYKISASTEYNITVSEIRGDMAVMYLEGPALVDFSNISGNVSIYYDGVNITPFVAGRSRVLLSPGEYRIVVHGSGGEEGEVSQPGTGNTTTPPGGSAVPGTSGAPSVQSGGAPGGAGVERGGHWLVAAVVVVVAVSLVVGLVWMRRRKN